MACWVADGVSLFRTTPPTMTLAILRQYVAHPHLYISPIHSTTTASWYPQGGKVEERSRCHATALTRKARSRAWERYLSSDTGIDEDDEAGRCAKNVSPVQDQGPPKYTPSSQQSFVFFIIRKPVDPALTLQQPDARASHSREDLQREPAPRGSQLAWKIFHAPTDAPEPPAADGRACTGRRPDGNGTGSLSLGRRADASTSPYPQERGEPDPARGAARISSRAC